MWEVYDVATLQPVGTFKTATEAWQFGRLAELDSLSHPQGLAMCDELYDLAPLKGGGLSWLRIADLAEPPAAGRDYCLEFRAASVNPHTRTLCLVAI